VRRTHVIEQIDVDRQSRFQRVGAISAIIILFIFASELVIVAIHGLPAYIIEYAWEFDILTNRKLGKEPIISDYDPSPPLSDDFQFMRIAICQIVPEEVNMSAIWPFEAAKNV
jgi:hypothetical protein